MSRRESHALLHPRLPRLLPGLSQWRGVPDCRSTCPGSRTRERNVSSQLPQGRTPLHVEEELQQCGGMGQPSNKPNHVLIHLKSHNNSHENFSMSNCHPLLSLSESSKLRAQNAHVLHMRNGTFRQTTKSRVEPAHEILSPHQHHDSTFNYCKVISGITPVLRGPRPSCKPAALVLPGLPAAGPAGCRVRSPRRSSVQCNVQPDGGRAVRKVPEQPRYDVGGLQERIHAVLHSFQPQAARLLPRDVVAALFPLLSAVSPGPASQIHSNSVPRDVPESADWLRRFSARKEHNLARALGMRKVQLFPR